MMTKQSLDSSPDKTHFKAIVDLCMSEGWLHSYQMANIKSSNYDVPDISPVCVANHPKIPELLALVERMGCSIYEHSIPKNHGPKPIAWTIIRDNITMREIKKAEHVLVGGWGVESGIYSGWIALSEAGPVTFDKEIMGRLLRQKFLWYTERGFGAVNAEGRRILEEAGIKGVAFDPVEWTNPEEVKGALYNLRHRKTLPPCLLPVIELRCGALLYHEGPYNPQILRYRRSEVEAMGDWDIAQTAEITGPASPPLFHRRCVISARFRDVLLENKIPLTATPIVLVDD